MEKKGLSFKQILILLIVALFGIWLINNLSTFGEMVSNIGLILYPFILGGCLAFILNIPMSFFEKRFKKIKNKKLVRILSIVFAIIIIVLVIALVIILIVPRLIEVVQLLIDNIPYYTEHINKFLENAEIEFSLSEASIDTDSLKNQILEQIPTLLTSSISIVSNIISSISNLFISIIFAIYILIDKEKLQRQINKLMNAYLKKNIADRIRNVGTTASSVFRKFFTVQCLEATILGALCIIGMLILRIPYAVPIGVLVGVTALIPVVGAFIGMGIGAILIVSVSPIKVLYFVIFLLILQQIEGNFIYPRVVGSSVGLPGMWVLFAVTVGGSIGGIIGMLLGVPIATTIYNLLKMNTNKKLEGGENIE